MPLSAAVDVLAFAVKALETTFKSEPTKGSALTALIDAYDDAGVVAFDHEQETKD